jgi:hypothetical protein
MNKIEQQLARFKNIDVWEIVRETIIQNKEVLIDLVTEQLSKGEIKTGRTAKYELIDGKSPYAEAKSALGTYDMSIFPHANLFKEGDFYDGIDAFMHSEFIEIVSSDSKAGELESEFTSEIYELNQKRMLILKGYILPIVNKKIRNALRY